MVERVGVMGVDFTQCTVLYLCALARVRTRAEIEVEQILNSLACGAVSVRGYKRGLLKVRDCPPTTSCLRWGLERSVF